MQKGVVVASREACLWYPEQSFFQISLENQKLKSSREGGGIRHRKTSSLWKMRNDVPFRNNRSKTYGQTGTFTMKKKNKSRIRSITKDIIAKRMPLIISTNKSGGSRSRNILLLAAPHQTTHFHFLSLWQSGFEKKKLWVAMKLNFD